MGAGGGKGIRFSLLHLVPGLDLSLNVEEIPCRQQ
jgi:hypothetical protein